MPHQFMPYEVPEQKQVRVIINTDAKCEADDQYAIVHAILSQRLQIKGFIGAHFGTRSATSMQESYEEVEHVLQLMGMRDQYGVYRGTSQTPGCSYTCSFRRQPADYR